MSQNPTDPTQPQVPPTPSPTTSAEKVVSAILSHLPGGQPNSSPTISAEEVANGRAFAILSYVLGFLGLPFFLVPLIMRDNEFSLYHSKQCLMVWLLALVGGAVGGVALLVCIGAVILLAVWIGAIVLNIIGMVNAINGQTKPLPFIGIWGEEWFKGVTKVQK